MTLTRVEWGPVVVRDSAVTSFERTSRWTELARIEKGEPLFIVVRLPNGWTQVDDTPENWDKLMALNL